LCLGLFSKTVLADSVFAPLVDQVYSNPAVHNAAYAWAAVFGFSGQIYFDFSGYSLCAIGLALCFGFEFPDNFRYPYAARGFSDFWRRWHITLSSWLRDYLYFPLGGNRHGTLRTYVNLMLTMLIGGLWHGASWMFVLWGGLHGFYLAIERWGRDGSSALARLMGRLPPAVAAFGVFLVVTLTWIPFRAHSAATALQLVQALFRSDAHLLMDFVDVSPLYACAAVVFYWHFLQRDGSLEERFSRLGTGLQTVIVSCCLIGIFLCSGGDESAFIYFQF